MALRGRTSRASEQNTASDSLQHGGMTAPRLPPQRARETRRSHSHRSLPLLGLNHSASRHDFLGSSKSTVKANERIQLIHQDLPFGRVFAVNVVHHPIDGRREMNGMCRRDSGLRSEFLQGRIHEMSKVMNGLQQATLVPVVIFCSKQASTHDRRYFGLPQQDLRFVRIKERNALAINVTDSRVGLSEMPRKRIQRRQQRQSDSELVPEMGGADDDVQLQVLQNIAMDGRNKALEERS
mmetsp:Transcript_20718/g.55331  ORF Transcript_20718/g.55331 Transcript_20718/m.55331 type:complete len:238 (-) Transcript_20718:909-1622(-)